MIPVSSFFSASIANKNRTPIYRAKFAGIATEYSSHPIKANYADEVLADGPNAYYRFGESVTSPVTTVAADSSGNALNGTYHGLPTLAVTGALAGDGNTAVQLSGSGQYVTVPYNALLDPGDDFTLELWVYPTSFAGSPYLLDRGTNGYAVQLNSSGAFLLLKSGVSTIVTSAANLTPNAWNHIVITKNGATVHQYLNAKDVTGSVTNATIVGLNNPLSIGESGSPPVYFSGSLDELAIYPQALSPARVQAHYDTARLLFWRRNVSPFMMIDQTQQSPRMTAAQVIPERGQSSVGTLTFVLADLADYDSEVLSDNPNLYLQLNELKAPVTSPPTAWAIDSSGNNLNGFYQGSPQFGQIGPIRYIGSPDWGALLTGSSYVSVPHNALEQPGDVFTLEAWVNFANVSAGVDPIFETGNNGFGFYRSGNNIVLRRTGVQTIAIGTGALPGGWTHVVVTKNGSAVHLYINGVEGTGSITNSAITATGNDLEIGYDGTNHASGAFARAAIYPTALSAARVLAHYNAALARPANSVNGAITRLIANEIQGLTCTFSLGFDDITEANYLQLPYGVVNDVVSTQDLTGYSIIVKDPQTLTNKQIFNVSATTLPVAMGVGDTSLAVADGSGFDTSGYVIIDSEIIAYTGKTFTGVAIGEDTWAAVTYGAGTFVAVAQDGAVYSSVDGINWTLRTSAEANQWNGVCYSSTLGLFVAVASTGTHRVMTSPDGAAWTARTAAAASAWTAVAWSPSLGLFAAVASTPDVMTSPDGITWTSRSCPPVSLGPAAIDWSPDLGIFSTGTLYSTDGITWKVAGPINSSGAWTGIAWSPDLALFAAVSNDNPALIATSTDGKNWTPRAVPGGAGQIFNICWSHDKSLFVAVANMSPSFFGILTSPDGITWTGQSILVPNVRTWHGIVWAPSISKFIACNVNGTTTTAIATSPDGVTWTGQTVAHAQAYECIAWSPSLALAVVVASGTVGAGTRVTTSPDGVTWTERTEAEANEWVSVCWSPTLALFCAVALNGTHQVMTSTNGTTWTARTAAEANQWQAVVWADTLGLFVAVASSGTHRVMTSPDGITWTARTAAEANSWWRVEWSNALGLLVAVSRDGSDRAMISTDGITWTIPSNVLPGDPWNGIVWAHALSLFVAVSNSGVAYTSPDAVVWTSRSVPEPNSWNAICWSSTIPLLVAVASGGTHRVMTSPDGVTWTARTAADANSWDGVAFGGGIFAAVASTGSGDRAMYSTDGITWTVSASSLTGLTRGALDTIAATHSVGATIRELIRLFGHLIDVVSGVLQNTDKTGLSIDPSLVDNAGLAIIKANNPAWQVEFRISAAANAKTFLEQECYQVFGLYPVTRAGLYSIHQMATLVTAVDTITADSICVDTQNEPVIQWDRNFQATIINSITFNYDYDGSKYGAQNYFPDAPSIAKFGEYPLVINSQGLRSGIAGTAAFLATIASVFLGRYASGAPLVAVRTFLQKLLQEPGDTIGVTYAYLPNRSAKTRGVTNALMEVNSREIDMDEGYVQMNLLWPGW